MHPETICHLIQTEKPTSFVLYKNYPNFPLAPIPIILFVYFSYHTLGDAHSRAQQQNSNDIPEN